MVRTSGVSDSRALNFLEVRRRRQWLVMAVTWASWPQALATHTHWHWRQHPPGGSGGGGAKRAAHAPRLWSLPLFYQPAAGPEPRRVLLRSSAQACPKAPGGMLPSAKPCALACHAPRHSPPACPFARPPTRPPALAHAAQPGSTFDVVSTDFWDQRCVGPGEFVLVPSKSAFSSALLARLGVAEDTGRRASSGYHVGCPIMRVLF